MVTIAHTRTQNRKFTIHFVNENRSKNFIFVFFCFEMFFPPFSASSMICDVKPVRLFASHRKFRKWWNRYTMHGGLDANCINKTVHCNHHNRSLMALGVYRDVPLVVAIFLSFEIYSAVDELHASKVSTTRICYRCWWDDNWFCTISIIIVRHSRKWEMRCMLTMHSQLQCRKTLSFLIKLARTIVACSVMHYYSWFDSALPHGLWKLTLSTVATRHIVLDVFFFVISRMSRLCWCWW